MTEAEQPATWENRQEAAQELSLILGEPIGLNTMSGWLRQPDCPLPKGRGPIPKAPIIEWCKRERRPGQKGNRDSDFATLEREKLIEEIRKLRGTNARIYAESVNADEARQGIVRAVEELRRELTQEIPSAAWAMSQGKPAEEGVAAIRAMLTEALNRFATQAGRIAP